VRVIETPADMAAFVSGDVLVTPTPNPAWTPIYALASALVTSTGSVLSHGLVSAREYQLPAVIGIPDVTKRLGNGQRVTVDGDQGTVSIET
jgi:pyruvate,water dikinase